MNNPQPNTTPRIVEKAAATLPQTAQAARLILSCRQVLLKQI